MKFMKNSRVDHDVEPCETSYSFSSLVAIFSSATRRPSAPSIAEEDTTMVRVRAARPRSRRRGAITLTSVMAFVITVMIVMLLMATAAARSATSDDMPKEEQEAASLLSYRLSGMFSLFQARPGMCVGLVLRIGFAITLEVALDGFLKGVVTPALAATGIGVAVTPLTFLIGQALQPIIHSFAFIVFDDRLLDAALAATGVKRRLISRYGGNWHRMTILEGMLTRYVMKTVAVSCVGMAGLCTIIPVVGPILTALLSGWVVAWDFVYIPLSGMGHVGVLRQSRVVLRNFWAYHWFGFWAVLIEEIPLVGPACHVYNLYSAAFFLESLYLDGTSTSTHIIMNYTMASNNEEL